MPTLPASSAAAALVLLIGCAAHRQSALPLQPAELAELSAKIDGRRAVVRYTSRSVYSTNVIREAVTGDVHVRGDSVVVEEEDREVPLALARIEEIDANHPGRAAVKGLGVGLVLGLLAGGVVGVTLADTCPEGHSRCAGRPASTPEVMVTAGVLGLLTGATIGALRGSGPVWRFSGP